MNHQAEKIFNEAINSISGEITSTTNGRVRLRAVRANGSGSAFQLTGYTSLYIKASL